MEVKRRNPTMAPLQRELFLSFFFISSNWLIREKADEALAGGTSQTQFSV